MSEGGAEWCGEGKRSMWLEGVHGQSLDAFTVQSGWERVCGRVVVGGGPGPATIQGHGRLAPMGANPPLCEILNRCCITSWSFAFKKIN